MPSEHTERPQDDRVLPGFRDAVGPSRCRHFQQQPALNASQWAGDEHWLAPDHVLPMTSPTICTAMTFTIVAEGKIMA
jgi:hypothetical protein